MDILSYFRRSKPPASRAPEAGDFGQELGQELGDVAIDLETIGGEINGTYLDIASSPAPEKRARKKAPERPPRERSPERQPERPPQFDRQPERQPERPPERQFDRQPERQPERQAERQAERQPAPQRDQRPPRPRRRSDGNGAFPGGERSKGVLAVHGVEKSFVGRMVVKGVSLYVRKGEAVGLLGPNGAGKTTVFYMATGLIKADKGRIELDGRDVTKLPMYQRARLGIGYLPQEASIFRGLNVEENIRSVLEVVEPDAKRRERDLDSLLEEFNIARLRKTPSIALSGGERRRVEIARALASRPNYMLLDEPFAGIDPIAVGDIQTLVRHLTNRGIGVLITDHNVRETLGLTDRAYIIYSGEVLMEGRADDIVNNPDVRRLYLGEEFRL
ncbi:MAG TPA: LPS export ABC transporter ATP-binding protein [Xanthobacteraceae bacterium]|nr:LPS export ABC transporter ATP-binding protein [Xanthobacteraceae bacterium]